MRTLLVWMAQKFYGQKILNVIDATHDHVVGYRTEIISGIIILVYIAGHLGLITMVVAWSIINILWPMLPVTLADKIKGVMSTADGVLPPPSKIGDKPGDVPTP